MVLFLLQIPLGVFAERQRRQWKKQENPGRPTMSRRVMGLVHPLTGWAVLFLAVVDAGLGFNLALTNAFSIVWIPLVIGIFVVILIASGVRYMWRTHREDAEEEAETFKHDRSAFGNDRQSYAMHNLGNRLQEEDQYESVSIPRGHI
jgi:hypothetical protein